MKEGHVVRVSIHWRQGLLRLWDLIRVLRSWHWVKFRLLSGVGIGAGLGLWFDLELNSEFRLELGWVGTKDGSELRLGLGWG